MTFATDADFDRDNVFLNALEFAESVSYRVAASDTTLAAFDAHVEDEGDSIIDDGIEVWISADDVAAPSKGDQITRALEPGAVYTVQFITEEVRMFKLDCTREEIIT